MNDESVAVSVKNEERLHELKEERAELFAELEANGGRGVDLAEAIDELDCVIERLQNPLTLREAQAIVLNLAQRYIEEVGVPDDDAIADMERMRAALCDEAINKLQKEVE